MHEGSDFFALWGTRAGLKHQLLGVFSTQERAEAYLITYVWTLPVRTQTSTYILTHGVINEPDASGDTWHYNKYGSLTDRENVR